MSQTTSLLDRPLRLTFWALLLIGIGWVLLVEATAWDHSIYNLQAIVVGVLFGTMFGQATIAAAWAAFGPGPLLYRWPLSLIWCLVLVAAVCLPTSFVRDLSILLQVSSLIIAPWLIAQILFTAIALTTRLQLRTEQSVGSSTTQPSGRRFGTRQFLIFTALVAVALGLLRVILITGNNSTSWQPSFPRLLLVSVACLVLPFVISVTPLVLSLGRQSRAGLSATVSLVFVALSIPIHDQIFRRWGSFGSQSELLTFALLNAIGAGWVLAFGIAVRASGYRLRRSPTVPRAATMSQS